MPGGASSTAGGASSILGWGTKIPHATLCGQKAKQNKNANSNSFCIRQEGFITMEVHEDSEVDV